MRLAKAGHLQQLLPEASNVPEQEILVVSVLGVLIIARGIYSISIFALGPLCLQQHSLEPQHVRQTATTRRMPWIVPPVGKCTYIYMYIYIYSIDNPNLPQRVQVPM